ncbi:FAHD2 protein, partial [Columbina picui]|nr:FAHD2 protein [Columbina picui]
TDVHNLRIRCSVNGQVMQDSSTSQLIFPLPKLIAWVSRFVTLVPGDILLTGTPAGVGFFRKPPVFLKVGKGLGGQLGARRGGGCHCVPVPAAWGRGAVRDRAAGRHLQPGGVRTETPNPPDSPAIFPRRGQ